jgi:hypothetical protein
MFATINRNFILNLMSGFIAGISFVGLACSWNLGYSWSNAAPEIADSAHGQIYAQHINPAPTFYFTAFQTTSMYLLIFPPFVGLALASAIRPKRNVIMMQKWLSFRVKWDDDDPFNAMIVGSAAGVITAFPIILGLGPSLVNWLVSMGVVLHW